ncbi:MAG: hypothetical protein Q9209_001275 [Squamulea sp. 1 TL-2023]
MSDYAPPVGPPPPRVPEGWKAQWNEQYHEWFYVNLNTKVSQWEFPTQPAQPVYPSSPSVAPPGYSGAGVSYPEKDFHSNNPYSSHPQRAGQNLDSDAAYAARLQAEEDERARVASGGRPVSRGAADQYHGQPQQQPGYPGGPGLGHQQQPQPPGYVGGYPGAPSPSQSYDQQQLPPREEKSKGLGGLLGKLTGKASGGSSHGGGYPQQHGYGGGGGYPQQHGYGGGMGGGVYGAPHKKPGLGPGGGLALGAGGGLLGGALLGSAMGSHHGGDYGGDDGGGYGGDDGGSYGMDDGGGDFGGGD